MSIAFWSEEVSKGSGAEVQPPEGYVLNCTQMALQTSHSSSKSGYRVFATTEDIHGDERKSLLGTLRPISCENTQLSLVFGYDIPVKFSVEGGEDSKASVFISGYFQPGPEVGDEDDDDIDYMDAYDDDDDDEEEEEEDDEDENEQGGAKKKKKIMNQALSSAVAAESSDEESSSSGSDDSSEDEKVDEMFISKMIAKNHPEMTGGGWNDPRVEELSSDDEYEKPASKPKSKSQKGDKAGKGIITSGKKNDKGNSKKKQGGGDKRKR